MFQSILFCGNVLKMIAAMIDERQRFGWQWVKLPFWESPPCSQSAKDLYPCYRTKCEDFMIGSTVCETCLLCKGEVLEQQGK